MEIATSTAIFPGDFQKEKRTITPHVLHLAIATVFKVL